MSPEPPHIRAIRSDELSSLLSLCQHLHPSDPELPVTADVEGLWQRICADLQLHYLGADVSGTLVSTCTLAILPNLTRSARSYGLIENVVTHPEFRRQGTATSLLRFALQLAWAQGCYKVMLLTGRRDPATLRFYEQAGFQAGVKDRIHRNTMIPEPPNQALQRTLRACHEFCLRSPRATPEASLSLRSLGNAMPIH